MFIQIKDNQPYGYPIVDENLRQLIPHNVSLPPYPLTKDVLSFGFAIYEFAPKPDVQASDFKIVEEGTPVWTNDDIRGDYVTQVWNVRDMTTEEVSRAIEQQWVKIQLERSAKLTLCDWTQLSDVPLTTEQKTAWATYRQALRDITTQTDPFNITWPVSP